MGFIDLLGRLFRPAPTPFHLRQLNRRHRGRNQAIIRGLVQPVSVGRGMILSRVLGRYKMLLDADDRGLSPHLILDGFWEMWVTEAIADVVKPDMVVADIGANLGYFTMVMAELVGPGGQVHAFEPNPALAGMIVTSSEMNGFGDRITVHASAVGGNGEDLFRLAIPPGYPSGGHLVPISAEEAAGMSSEQRLADPTLIEAQRLDVFPALSALDVVKIDAEGAEQAIWSGMAGIFDGNRPMVVFLEFTLCRYSDPAAFLTEIMARNFNLAIVTLEHGVRPATIAEILAAPARQDQMLMLRRA